MAINVIHSGSVDSFDYLAFPNQNPANTLYIQNQLTNFSQSLTDIGRKFIETSQAIYERVNDSNAIRAAKAAVRMAKGMFHPNEIRPLTTMEDIRFAQPIMQRYIMAQPDLRQMYHRQQCDGFSESYVDIEPNRVGLDHYDYRRVMSGIVVDETTPDGEDGWVSRTFFEDERGIDAPLDFADKVNILKTWDLVSMFVEAGKDPSDPFGK
jgi:hypothetical protein